MTSSNHTPENNHTREKLRVFSDYVNHYQNILFDKKHKNYVHRIDIYDMFAGRGLYGKDAGNAMLALETIKKIREKSERDVRLNLVDSDATNYLTLQETIKTLYETIKPDINEWVSCQQVETNDAINKYLEDVNHKIYKLFYLDPFGYSRIEKETLESIISIRNVECLLFVPISSAMDKAIPSIKKFLNEYGIDTSTYEKTGLHALEIKNVFADIYSDNFVSVAELSVSEHKYALYFIGNNVQGLDKFLDIVTDLKTEYGYQIELITSENKEIIDYLSEGTKTNIDLYIWGLKQGWIPSETKEALTDLENKQRITVACHTGKNRGKGAFYIGLNYYKNYCKDKKIPIEVSLVK